MKKRRQTKRGGSTTALAMVTIIVLLAMGVGLLALGMNRRIYAIRSTRDVVARCAADAGLTMALFQMNDKLKTKPWKVDTLPQGTNVSLPCCSAVFDYKVTGDLGSGYSIESVGTSGMARRIVRSTIGLVSPFEFAILTKGTLTVKSGTTVDSYNSTNPSDTDTSVIIGSQSSEDSSVVLNMGSTVEGDVSVAGNLNSAIKDLGATITGDKFVAPPSILPDVVLPALSDMGSIGVSGTTVTITPTESGTYSAIDLKKTLAPGVLQVSGGHVILHVTGDIDLGNSCEIVIAEGSSLTIYTDGDIHCREGSSIGTEVPTKVADTLQIYGTGEGTQYFDLKAKNEFTGVVYAPDADVDLYANGDIYGSVVAHDFAIKSGGDFHYDRALQKKNSVDDDAVRFVVTYWSESKSSTADTSSNP